MSKGKGKERNHRSQSWEGRESRDMKRDFKRKQQREDRGDDSRTGKVYGLNDFTWYNKFPELAQGVGRVAFPYRPGMSVPFQMVTEFTPDADFKSANYNVPGVMSLEWAPSLGRSASVTDPASIAGKELYAQIRKSFSGALDADAPDLVIYLGALDSVFSYISWLKRLYSVIDCYTPYNYMVPEGVLRALNLSQSQSAELRADKAQLWYNINTLIRMTQKFQMPAVMPLFNRHFWMNANVYTDAPSIQSQMYLFDQVWYYQFSMLEVTSGVSAGGLKMVARPGTLDNPFVAGTVVDQLYQFGVQLISALAESDDGYTISGYFMRAFEGQPTFQTTLLEQELTFNPVFQPEVLAQIESSATVLPDNMDVKMEAFDALNVVQVPANNVINCAPRLIVSNSGQLPYVGGNTLLSVRPDVPTVEDVFIATRLKAQLGPVYSVGSTNYANVRCGTEIPLQWQLHTGSEVGVKYPSVLYYPARTTAPTLAVWQDAISRVRAAMMAQAFDWHPISVAYLQSNGSSPIQVQLLGDAHNVTTLTESELQELHRVAVYSELNAFTA